MLCYCLDALLLCVMLCYCLFMLCSCLFTLCCCLFMLCYCPFMALLLSFRMVQVQDIPVHQTRAQNQICVEHHNQSPQSQVQCPSPKTHLAPFSLTSQICSIIPIYMQGEGRLVPLPLLPQLQPGIPM